MRAVLLTLILMLTAGLALAQPAEFFHSLQEAYQFLYDLEEADTTNSISVDSVGHSEEDHLPILLVKISDNVDVDYDRPTVLFIGHIHGEEIMGLEIVLRAIEELATLPYPIIRDRRDDLEM